MTAPDIECKFWTMIENACVHLNGPTESAFMIFKTELHNATLLINNWKEGKNPPYLIKMYLGPRSSFYTQSQRF